VNSNGYQNMQVTEPKIEKSPKERKRQNDTGVKRFSKLIIIVAVVLAGLGIGSRFFGRKMQADKVVRKSPEVRIYKMGQGVKVGYLTFAAWNAQWYEKSSNNPYLNVKPDSCYLLVKITLKNDSNRRKIKPLFILIDEKGFSYELSKKWYTGVGNLNDFEFLSPGVSMDGYIVFDVRKNLQYTLRVSASYRPNSYALIKIEPE
jgi:hypothetical protein